jgi:hypothetical protein
MARADVRDGHSPGGRDFKTERVFWIADKVINEHYRAWSDPA